MKFPKPNLRELSHFLSDRMARKPFTESDLSKLSSAGVDQSLLATLKAKVKSSLSDTAGMLKNGDNAQLHADIDFLKLRVKKLENDLGSSNNLLKSTVASIQAALMFAEGYDDEYITEYIDKHTMRELDELLKSK